MTTRITPNLTSRRAPAVSARLVPAAWADAVSARLARWPRTVAALRLTALGTLTLGLGVLLGTAAVTLEISRTHLAITSGSATLLVVLVTVLQPRLLFDQEEGANPGEERRARRARRSPTPTATLRRATAGKGSGRTPQAVETLAAAGAEPTDIAWQTGLPVDAISMVLTMARRRQVPPAVR
ncbi:MAG: hypothetical protein KJT01_11790 [Gemmatimonadetes bacterium]|nr:hypothetical protein [Gemmatimonadota bacterium]